MKTVTYDEMLWKLVPVEPTEEMLNCGPAPANDAEKFAADLAAGYRKNIWAAMLASTPAPAQQERKPMTDAEIEDLCGEANRGFCIELDDYKKAVQDTERHHGIRE